MASLHDKAADFLAQRRIAVAGVSRRRQDAANNIYRKLKSHGRQVFALNPKTDQFDGDPCYPDLKSIPAKVDGVVIVTRPEITERIVKECVECGVRRVWMHQSLVVAGTSVSPAGERLCRESGIQVIAGACPMMFCQPVDFGHKCMRWMLGLFGKLPD